MSVKQSARITSTSRQTRANSPEQLNTTSIKQEILFFLLLSSVSALNASKVVNYLGTKQGLIMTVHTARHKKKVLAKRNRTGTELLKYECGSASSNTICRELLWEKSNRCCNFPGKLCIILMHSFFAWFVHIMCALAKRRHTVAVLSCLKGQGCSTYLIVIIWHQRWRWCLYVNART